MSPPRAAVTPAEIYDQAIKYARDFRLPPDAPRPLPTSDWPVENVRLLERYVDWLKEGGASESVIHTIYVPMAGHVLGLFMKPHAELDLDNDLAPALAYVQAKVVGAEWVKISRSSLQRFRRFVLNQRGQVEIKRRPYRPEPHTEGLPAWLVEELMRFQRLMQCNWRDARLEENITRFWSGHLRVWRYLCDECGVRELADVRRKQLYDYAARRLSQGKAVSTTNADLSNFHSFLTFLQEQSYSVPQALLRIRKLKEPERLPRHLTDEQVRLLWIDLEDRAAQAKNIKERRDALLDRAIFYLLWQSGLRRGEVEELRLEDLDLPGRKLSVRNGKGHKDRTVYLTEATIRALKAYLEMRGPGPTDHVFLYRNQPLSKDLIHGRLRAAGERTAVYVTAHRLRHTCGTQLLNSGCPVTSIQKIMGHKKLNTTMIYARAHDLTVEADYFAAISRVEERLELAGAVELCAPAVDSELLEMVDQLAVPELSQERRLELVLRLRNRLAVVANEHKPDIWANEWIPPPVIPALVAVNSI